MLRPAGLARDRPGEKEGRRALLAAANCGMSAWLPTVVRWQPVPLAEVAILAAIDAK